MKERERVLRAACSSLIAAVLTGVAGVACAQQSPQDVRRLKEFAGTYAMDCAKAGTVRLQVDVKSLAVVAGDRRVQAKEPLAAVDYFGKAEAPPGYQLALMGYVKPNGIAFIVMRDAGGVYLEVEPDRELDARFGKGALAGKFRRCA